MKLRQDTQYPTPRPRGIEAFWIGKFEVTKCQWRHLRKFPTGEDQITFENVKAENENIDNIEKHIAAYCSSDEGKKPIVNVSYSDAKAFVDQLNDKYKYNLPANATKYRLPVEAEWEYAAQAWESGELYDPAVEKIAWHKENSDEKLMPVGELWPNAFGLHDMLGNVWEWVDSDIGEGEIGHEALEVLESLHESIIGDVGMNIAAPVAAAIACAGAGTLVFPIVGTVAGVVACGAAVGAVSFATNLFFARRIQRTTMVLRGGSFKLTKEMIGSSIRMPGHPGDSPETEAEDDGTIDILKELASEQGTGLVRSGVDTGITHNLVLSHSAHKFSSGYLNFRQGFRLAKWAKGKTLTVIKEGFKSPMFILTTIASLVIDRLKPFQRDAEVWSDVGFRVSIHSEE